MVYIAPHLLTIEFHSSLWSLAVFSLLFAFMFKARFPDRFEKWGEKLDFTAFVGITIGATFLIISALSGIYARDGTGDLETALASTGTSGELMRFKVFWSVIAILFAVTCFLFRLYFGAEIWDTTFAKFVYLILVLATYFFIVWVGGAGGLYSTDHTFLQDLRVPDQLLPPDFPPGTPD